jgi:hypothetical protein
MDVDLSPVSLALHRLSSAEYRDDLTTLIGRGYAIPHQYRVPEEPHSLWCRVSRDGVLLSGFVVQESKSRAVPGTTILRVDRLGRALHLPLLPHLSRILSGLTDQFRRVLRLDIAVFDEDDARRALFSSALTAAGLFSWSGRSYQCTLKLPLDPTGSDDALLSTFSASTRRNIRSAERAGVLVAPIRNCEQVVPTIRTMYQATFRRTGAEAPPLDIEDMLNAGSNTPLSVVFGAFLGTEQRPEQLVAFAWVRSHGDHACYDVAASARRPELGRLPLGYPLLWQGIRWAKGTGHRWMDLGGIPASSVLPSSPLHAIAAFKRGFSHSEITVGESFRLEPSPLLRRGERLVRWFTSGNEKGPS